MKRSMKAEINRASTILMGYSLLLATASLFSIPFPFVRQIWIREIWGISGLVHAFIFLVIKMRIQKASFAAGVAGFGLILNEQILAWRTFLYDFTHGTAVLRDAVFLSGSVLFNLFLAAVLWSVCKAIYKFRVQQKDYNGTDTGQIEGYEESDFAVLIGVILGYAATFGMLYIALFLKPTSQYGIFKILGALISLFSFGGIGHEINLYAQAKQTLFFCATKAVSHGLLLAAILWVIYHKIPISSAIV